MKVSKELFTGAEIILKSLEKEKIDIVFGYPGGAVLPLYDALYNNKNIKHVLTRHEQGAGHAADGYARATGKIGVAFATSGPGATNLVTAIATASMDSIPMVFITGQVARRYLGKQGFQEANIVEIVKPITKYSKLITKIEDLTGEIKKAFRIANSGRKGPVLIDIPKDVMSEKMEFEYPLDIAYRVEAYGENSAKYSQLAELLKASEKPLLFVGGGAIDAVDEVRELVEIMKCPLIYSLMGKGVLPDSHPLNIGMLGMHGTGTANYAVSHCDLLFAIGARFDDRATGEELSFATKAKIIHLDIDKKEFNKNIKTTLSLHDDSALGLHKLLKFLQDDQVKPQMPWIEQVSRWQENHPLVLGKDEGVIKPQEVLLAINKAAECLQESDQELYLTTEVGQHQMWAAQYFKAETPRSFITSGGLGTMGFGLPSSLGIQLGKTKDLVVVLAGDGSIQMNIQELMTIRENNLPIKIIVVNNRSLGMVRQWQKLFFNENYSSTLFHHENSQPDFIKLALSYGIEGIRVENKDELQGVIEEAFKNRRPQLIEVIVDGEENVYPMVPAGSGNDTMIFND